MSWEPADPDDPTRDALVGDEPCDLFAQAIQEISECYQRDLGRKPSAFELAKTMERVLATHFGDVVAEGADHHFVGLSFKTRKRPKRQKCAAGDFLKAKAANGQPVYLRVFEVNPGCGHMIGVYDSLGLENPNLEDLRSRRLIVKVTPIHYECLEDYEWTVIGSLPIDDRDHLQPRGPIEIWGLNAQLMAANFFYGLSSERFLHIEDFLNR